jgi:hypothetical protein
VPSSRGGRCPRRRRSPAPAPPVSALERPTPRLHQLDRRIVVGTRIGASVGDDEPHGQRR